MVLRKIQDAYLRTFESLGVDMTIEQWVILHQVHELGVKASQRDVVQSNFRNRATISRVIGGLERKGWIRKARFEGDQKRFRLIVTTEGESIIERVLPVAIKLRKQAIDGMNLIQFETFLSVLDQVGDNYDRF